MRIVGACLRAGFCLALVGCGKYGPPVPPESLAPAAVRELVITPATEGVTLQWTAPTQNQRRRELEDIDGYRIVRRTVAGPGSVAATDSTLATIADTHLDVQADLRRQAAAEGRPTRRIKADPALSVFSYIDRTVTPGETYLYRVIPFNQGGVDGATGTEIRVAFNGAGSVVERLTPGGLAALGEPDPFDAEDSESE